MTFERTDALLSDWDTIADGGFVGAESANSTDGEALQRPCGLSSDCISVTSNNSF